MNSKVIAIYQDAPDTKSLIGSGFLVDNQIIITATHVVKQNEKIISKIFGSVLVNDIPKPLELEFIKSIENTDISILKIKNSLEEKINLPFFNIGEEYYSGDEVLICGFPGAFFNKKGNPIPSSFPMLRKGIIASLYEKMGNTNLMILDIMGLMGFGGSPIIHQKTRKAIAVFSQIPGGYNSGFSLAYPIKQEYLEKIL